jgi:AGCS family alanine or glycine:cation symporter
MILLTGAYNVHGVGDAFIVQNVAADVAANSPAYTQIAVDSIMQGFGKPFVAFALFFFAFTTILAYYFIAENNVSYIKRTFKIPALTFLLKVVIMTATFYGTVKAADVAWGMGDVGVGIMAWLNIIGIIIIFFMSKPAIKALKDYERQQKLGVEKYTFDPIKLGIKNADLWINKK